MRKLHRLIGVVVLTLTLMVPAFAGQIDLPKPNSSTPPPVTIEGDISTGVVGQTDTPSANGQISTGAPTSDSVLDLALSLVRGVLSLF